VVYSEVETRQNLIDPKLEAAGWTLQDRKNMNLFASRGIAVREFPLDTGFADYLLFVDQKPNSSEDTAEGRWRAFDYQELIARDKANLDIFLLRDESLEDSANLPAPEVLALEIDNDLEVVLEQIRGVLESLE